MKSGIRGVLMLLTATLIWGTSLVAQRMATASLKPFTFNAVRFLVGALALAPFALAMRRREQRAGSHASGERNPTLAGGSLCGIVLFATAAFQQIGISSTSVGKAGFITSLYIVIVPVLGMFLGKKTGWRAWAGVVLALCGTYLLCGSESSSLSMGDLFILCCAFTTAVHILLIDRYARAADGLTLTLVQFLVCAVLSAASATLFERTDPTELVAACGPILYTGIASCGIAYTLQTLGQKRVAPTAAALILSLESVFSVMAGWAVFRETLTTAEMAGCALVFAAVTIAQIPVRRGRRG